MLATPAELHGAMVAGATRAERRLALASLYIGCAQLTSPSGRLSAALRAADAGWFDALATHPELRRVTRSAPRLCRSGECERELVEAMAAGALSSSLYTRPAQAFLRATLPQAGRVARTPAAAGLLAERLPSPISGAQAGEMPIEDVVSIGGRNYAITNQGATYTLLGD